jgi:hypothetical protein
MHLLVVKLGQTPRLVPLVMEVVLLVLQVQAQRLLQLVELEPVPPEWKSLARTPQVQVLQLRRLQIRLVQDEHQLEQLYQLQHQLLGEFLQLVKEFQYQLCQLKLPEVLHLRQQSHQHFLTNE